MKPLIAALAITLIGAAGCTAVPPIPQHDYAHEIIGTWMYKGSRDGATFLMAICVFHADGRWGVRSIDGVDGGEDIRGRRWRIDGDNLIMTGPDAHLLAGDERHLVRTPHKIISFAPDKFVTTDDITRTYTRLEKRPHAPNQAMQRTPTRRSPQISHD